MEHFETRRIPALADVEVHAKAPKYPRPLQANLPRMYWVGLWCGARGTGKTWSCVELLTAYERYGIASPYSGDKMPQRVILISPTVDANPVFRTLKWLDDDDIHTNYSDNDLLKIVDDIKAESDEVKEYQRQLKVYRKFLDDKRLTHEEILIIERLDYSPPIEPKYPDGRVVFLVLDDLIGSSAFKATGKSALTNLVLKNRHIGVNVAILGQNLRAIPRSIRMNVSVYVLFKFAADRVAMDLYEEVANLLTEEKFLEAYRWATTDDHDALVVDQTAPKEERLKRNWDTVIAPKGMGGKAPQTPGGRGAAPPSFSRGPK